MTALIVFFDIADEDSQRLIQFYSKLFGWEISENGHCNIPAVTPIPGAIRKDPSEKRIYIGVENITEKLAEIDAKRGTVDAQRFEVTGVGYTRPV